MAYLNRKDATMGKISKGLSELLACGAGILIGGLIARAINQNFWWVGMFVGGLIAYIAFDLPQVGRAIASARRMVSDYGLSLPSPKFYKRFMWCYLVCLFGITWIGIGSFIFVAIAEESIVRSFQLYCQFPTHDMAITILLGPLVPVLLFFAPVLNDDYDLIRIDKVAIVICPTIFPFWYLPKGIWYCLKRVPAGITLVSRGVNAFFRLAPRFIWQVYVRIHSASRLLCGIDAAIGVGIGWIAGSVQIGLVLGLAFYAVNRYLVTEWLVRSGQLAVRP